MHQHVSRLERVWRAQRVPALRDRSLQSILSAVHGDTRPRFLPDSSFDYYFAHLVEVLQAAHRTNPAILPRLASAAVARKAAAEAAIKSGEDGRSEKQHSSTGCIMEVISAGEAYAGKSFGAFAASAGADAAEGAAKPPLDTTSCSRRFVRALDGTFQLERLGKKKLSRSETVRQRLRTEQSAEEGREKGMGGLSRYLEHLATRVPSFGAAQRKRVVWLCELYGLRECELARRCRD